MITSIISAGIGAATSAFMPTSTPAPDTGGGFNMGMLGVGAQMIGGLAGAYGQYQEGQAKETYHNYQADIAEVNRKLKLQTQADIIEQGKVELGDYSRQIGEVIADNITAQAGSGLVISEDPIEGLSRMGDRQMDQTRKRIEDAAFAVGLEALGLQQSAVAERFAGANAASSATTTALTTGLSTVGSGINKLDKLGAFEKSNKGPKTKATFNIG